MSGPDQRVAGVSEGDVRAAVEAVAAAARQVPSWPWARGSLSARDVGSGFELDLAFSLADGAQVAPVVPYAVLSKLDDLQALMRKHGSRVFIVRCELTPAGIDSFSVDTESDPWPDGWADPDVLDRIGLPSPDRPQWLVDRLAELRPGDGSRRVSRAALWTAEAQHLLVELGPDWQPRGTGNALALVRARSPWLLDVIALDGGRGPTRGGRLLVYVLDLLDGRAVRTIGRGIAHDIASLEGPGARRLIAQVVFGPGMRLLESVQPYREAAAALFEAGWPIGAPVRNVVVRATTQASAAAWELAVAPSTSAPFALHAPHGVRELTAADDGYFSTELDAVLHDVQALAAIAQLDAAGRLAAMHERRDAKLLALRLDPTNRKSLRTGPAGAHRVQPSVSWAELTDGLIATVASMPRNAVVTLWEWRPGGAAARLSRRHDDGRLELEVRADRHMRSGRRGGAARDERLLAQGWLHPDSSGRGLPSWYWPGSADPRALCETTVETLRSVYQIDRPEGLGVEAVWGSSGLRIRTPSLPLLSWPLMPYVTQQGAPDEVSTARNGSYVATVAGDYVLTTVDGHHAAVVDDASTLDHLVPMAAGGLLVDLLPTATPADLVDITTTATFIATRARAGTVVRRDGKYLEIRADAAAEPSWHHDEDVIVTERRYPHP